MIFDSNVINYELYQIFFISYKIILICYINLFNCNKIYLISYGKIYDNKEIYFNCYRKYYDMKEWIEVLGVNFTMREAFPCLRVEKIALFDAMTTDIGARIRGNVEIWHYRWQRNEGKW